MQQGKVYFIGAGPGAADLLTIRALKRIQACPVCLYAGSLVPPEAIAEAPADAHILDTAPMTLAEIMAEIHQAVAAGKDVARVHSGDPSLYGAIGEQIRYLTQNQIAYEIIPGVPAYAAGAALLGQELTLPDISQTVILTRTARESTAMPNQEDLATLGKSGATLAIHLSVRALDQITRELSPFYGADCPVAVLYRISWPDQDYLVTTLAEMKQAVRAKKWTRTALVLVGKVLDPHIYQQDQTIFRDSALYHQDHVHVLRPKGKNL